MNTDLLGRLSLKKRGVSPLIATVLIIGFTVALAAIIITWGGRFIQDTTDDVDLQTKIGLECSKLNYEITSVACSGDASDIDDVSAEIVNNADVEIANIILRVTKADGTVEVTSSALPTGIDIFGSDTANSDPAVDLNTGDVTLIEAIAEVNVENNIEACENVIEEYTPFDDEQGDLADCTPP